MAVHASDSFSGCYPISIDDASALAPPAFDAYPAKPEKMQPSMVDLASHPRARRFRTMLREQEKAGPNFAGHYTIVAWGCGTTCIQFAIIDARTGKVYFPPHIDAVTYNHVAFAPNEPEPPFGGLRYRVDSRLLVVIGAENDVDAAEGITYYEWTGAELKRLRWLESEKELCEADPETPDD
jgi:hypothetical protein